MDLTLQQLRDAAEIVHQYVPPTAQYAWPLLARHAGCTVWVKHENHTAIGAFKVRGGVLYMRELIVREPDCAGVIGATRGNHGQSITVGARAQGLDAVIVVPEGNNPEKNEAMIAQGAELIVHGADFQVALEHAQALAAERRLHMVPSFDSALVRGVASYALELFDAAEPLDAVYVPIGLGSGICGVIAARNALGLNTEVIGVQAEGAPSYALSFDAGHAVSTNSIDTFADGLATRVPVAEAVEIINANAARVVTVADDAILAAQRLLLSATHNLAEPAGAAPLAALLAERDRMAGKTVAVVVSGGNADAANLKMLVNDAHGAGRSA
jgi:threonine dehydratase